jgi:hypothetical protein
MDEPTASLDFGNQVMVLREVRRLAERGIGVIMSTHAPDQALACADRVLLMQDGRLVAMGELLTPEHLEAVYGVAVAIGQIDGAERPVCVPRPGAGGAQVASMTCRLLEPAAEIVAEHGLAQHCSSHRADGVEVVGEGVVKGSDFIRGHEPPKKASVCCRIEGLASLGFMAQTKRLPAPPGMVVAAAVPEPRLAPLR